MAGYAGTLAAVRCLGRAGVRVTVAADRPALPASWSRWTDKRVACPPASDPDRFVSWLVAFGEREPGHVLYPSSDDTAFIFALHAERLRSSYHLYQPPLHTLLQLLDKRELADLARSVGLDSPQTYAIDNEADLARVAREARFPVVIKPRTQLLLRTHNKGVRVERPEDLAHAYRAYMRIHSYDPLILAERPSVAWPMVQEYHASADTGTWSVAGFVDRTSGRLVVRAGRKVLQRPRRLGVGILFEPDDLVGDVREKLATLCRAAGYWGVFEAELIENKGRMLLIDFNPRYYNQMAFDIARGLPLPLLAYAAAIGDASLLGRLLDAAERHTEDHAFAWCHTFVFRMMLLAQRASGSATRDEAETWRSWYASRRDGIVDAAFERGDITPGIMDVLLQLRDIRHPRAFFRAAALR